jgi:branched-chain amino acid transport system ATP-binding protein
VILLEVTQLSKFFGGLAAIDDLSFQVNKGEILGLIGPNGAGKTTLFNVITGVYRPSRGNIRFKEDDLVGFPPYEIAKKGIARTFQSTILYNEMTVLENVLVGTHIHISLRLWGALLNSKGYCQMEDRSRQKALEIIDFMGLKEVKDIKAKNLPHGHQRKLGACIALVTQPELLLLDEPVTGMNPVESADMIEHIKRIQNLLGITIVVIEHNMKALMGLSNRIVVINYGKLIAEGLPHEIRQNEQVIEAYLGREEGGER